MTAEAERTDRAALQECGDVSDADGVPLALYAAERLLASGRNATGIPGHDSPVADYVLRRASAPQWRSPNEAFLLQSLLRRIASPAAAEALRTLAVEIRNVEQISALVQDMHDHLGKLQRASRSAPGDLSWMGYGDEPWLLTLVSPTSFAAPVVMAVSSRQNRPRGRHAARDAHSGRRAARRWFRRSSRGVAGRPLRRSACGARSAVRLDVCVSCWEPRCSPAICCCATCIAKRKPRRCVRISSPASLTN